MLQFQHIEFHLVVGNHDILEKRYYMNLHLSEHYPVGNIMCTHEPLDVHIDERYNLCGHIHPAVRLKGKGKQDIRLPCFFFGSETGILPAFGSFTGLHTLKPLQDDKIFVIADQRVARVH